jgi:uncharacterized Tic20 family protein
MDVGEVAEETKEREFLVRALDYFPKRAPIFKDTTGTEALDVSKVAETVGRVLSFVMVAVGIFVAALSAYSILTAVNMFMNPLFIDILGFVGAINILCGLLAKK